MSTGQQVQMFQPAVTSAQAAASMILAQQPASVGTMTVQVIYDQIRQLAQSNTPAGQQVKYTLTHKVPEVEFGKAVLDSTIILAAQSAAQGNTADFRDKFIKSVDNLAAEFNTKHGGKREIKLQTTQNGDTFVMPNGYPPLVIGKKDDKDKIIKTVSAWYFSSYLAAQMKRAGQAYPDYLSDENIQRAVADPNSLNTLMGLQQGGSGNGSISPYDRAAIDFARMGVRAEIQERRADQRFEHRTELMELRHDQRLETMDLRHDQRIEQMQVRHELDLRKAEHNVKVRSKNQLGQFILSQGQRDAEAASRAYLGVTTIGVKVSAKAAEKHWMPTKGRQVFVRGYDKNGNPRYGTAPVVQYPTIGRMIQGAAIYAGGVALANWAGREVARGVLDVRNEALRRALGIGNEAIELFEKMYGPYIT